MFKKIEIWILYLLILIGIPIILGFGTLVRQGLEGRTSYKGVSIEFASDIAVYIARLPERFVEEVFGDPMRIDQSWVQISENWSGAKRFDGVPLEEEAYLLLSRYDGDLNDSVVELIDLTNFKVLHTWNPDISYINSLVVTKNSEFRFMSRDKTEDRYPIVHPLLMEDGSLIFNGGHTPLIKINYCSDLLWQNWEERFHHTQELDAEGNIWVPTSLYPFAIEEKYTGSDIDNFLEDGITKISSNGDILFTKSLSELFIENDMRHLLFSIGDPGASRDPTHLNDIEPVVTDGKFWKKGDVFLSLRHQSMILLYRPKTNEIVWLETGRTSYQHDVDILNDDTIGIFNNNVIPNALGTPLDLNVEILTYNFSNRRYTSYFSTSLIRENVQTNTGGAYKILPNGSLLVEETNHGRVLYFDENSSLQWEVTNRASDGYVYLVWGSRVFSGSTINSMIRNIVSTDSCDG